MCKQNINGLQPIIISTLYYESFFLVELILKYTMSQMKKITELKFFVNVVNRR